MRLFVSVPLASDVRETLASVQARLKESGADVRWVRPEHFHLTVKFLGDRPDALLPDIQDVCENLAAQTNAFRFRVCGASTFPRRKPEIKTLLLNIADGASEWKKLAGQADNDFANLGVPRENGLVPHITLGRLKSDRDIADLRTALARETGTDGGDQTADTIELVQSFLDPRGATYQTLRTWKLSSSPRINSNNT